MNDRYLTAQPDATVAIFSEGLIGSVAARALESVDIDVVRRPTPGWRARVEAEGSAWDAVIFDRVGAAYDPRYADAVSHLNRRAWVTATPFGLDGPMATYTGADLVCGAAGGLVAALRDENGLPATVPGRQAFIDIGQTAALAAIDGINRIRTTGAAVHLDLSGQEAVAFCTAQQECAHLIYECAGAGGVTRYSAPSGLFPCRDGLVRIIVLDDHQWLRFAAALGEPEWAERYRKIESRRQFADEITDLVSAWATQRSKFECEALLQAHGIAATAVRTAAEVGESAQFRHREFAAAGGRGLPGLVSGRGADGATRRRDVSHTLAGLNVLEVSNVLAVPLAGSLLGAMGANVVRLEDLDRLDLYRRNGPFALGVTGTERAAYFAGANYDKRSVAGRFADEDRHLVRSSVAWADVILENVGSSRLDRIGVSELLAGPSGADKMVVSVSGLGRGGPHGHYKGYAGNFHAYAGLDELVTQVHGPTSTLKTALADYDTAVWVALTIAAWGLGRRPAVTIDFSMAEVVALRMMKSARQPCPDGQVQRLSPTAEDPAVGLRFAAFEGRSDHDAPDPVAAAQLEGTPAYYCNTPADLLRDPQLAHRDFFVDAPHPELQRGRVLALPWKVFGRDRQPYRAAPLLGEANEWMTHAPMGASRESGDT